MPLSPTLGSLVNDSARQGVGEDGVIFAACCAMGGKIFYRAGTSKEKQEADKKKIQFCHETGDHMTFLNVFRKWQSLHEKDRGRWRKLNFINGKTMKIINETKREIETILRKELNSNLDNSHPEDQDITDVLQCLISKTIMSNFCHYLGHPKAGYYFIDKDITLTIHPSSVLLFAGVPPEWIIVEHILSTSTDFAVNVSRVSDKENWVNRYRTKLPVILQLLLSGTRKRWVLLFMACRCNDE